MSDSIELDILTNFGEYIQSNKLGLCKNTKLTADTLQYFLSKEIITKEEFYLIEAETKSYNQRNKFYDVLKSKLRQLPEIIAYFQKLRQSVPANVLEDFLKQNQRQIQLLKNPASRMPPMTDPIQHKNADVSVQLPLPVPVTSSSSSGLKLLMLPSVVPKISGEKTGLGSAAKLGFWETGKTLADTFDESNPNIMQILDNYLPDQKYPHKTKGLALIINHINFNGCPRAFRSGAKVDENNLAATLAELEFEVYGARDKTYVELKENIKQFGDMLEEAQADCLILVVMSHGDEQNNFMTRDRGWISSWTEVVERFNNANCPALIGKPKIFLFQFCRGSRTDGGTQSDSPGDQAEGAELKIPSWTDMLVCYSTLDGHYAFREPIGGTWFIQFVCQVLRRYGRKYDICKLLNIVSEMMKLHKGSEGQKQICPYYNIGFTKDFYLAKELD